MGGQVKYSRTPGAYTVNIIINFFNSNALCRLALEPVSYHFNL